MRIKRGVIAHKRRKNLMKHAKGFMWRRKNTFRAAKQALMKAWSYAYRDRRKKKSEFRQLWQVKINAATRQHGVTYSRFINLLSKSNIQLDRKMLAHLAEYEPMVFDKIVQTVKK